MPDQARLTEIYRQWRNVLEGHVLGFDPSRYSAPLLVKLPDAYRMAQRRILFCGQETYGWNWMGLTETDEATSVTVTVRENAETLADFLAHESTIETLVDGYAQFAFAEHYSGRGSPFWVAFREVQDWGLGALLWVNLSRFDYEAGSILRSPNLDEVLGFQGQLFASELAETAPDAIIFATGPNYDHLIERFFPGLTREPLAGAPTVVRLSHPALPSQTYRTYHPRGLRMQGRWADLSAIRGAIENDLG